MKRKVIGVVAAIALAALGTIILVRWVEDAEERALAGEEQVQVFIVREPVEAGTPIEDFLDVLDVDEVPVKVRAATAVTNLESMAGRVASVNLIPGEQLVASRLVVPQAFDNRDLQVEKPEGYLELSMAVSADRFISGIPRAGDTVAIIASFGPATLLDGGGIVLDDGGTIPLPDELSADQTEEIPETTHILMHKVLITEIQVTDITTQPETDDPTAPIRAPEGGFLVTFALSAPDVERLVFTNVNGDIWFALEPENAPEGGTKEVQRGNVFDSTEPEAADQ
ncbi:MAG: hypothetical protein RIE08_14030 [Acidimicrobiales bacterium]